MLMNDRVQEFISGMMGRCAVPLFYVISGYLFFLKVPDGMASIYGKMRIDKLDNRYAVLSLAVMSVLVEVSDIILRDDMSSNPLFSSLFERFTACIVTVFIFAVSYFLSGYCDFPKWLQTIGRDSMPFYAMNVIFVGGIRIILDRAGITNMALQCVCGFAGSTAICWILYECIIKKIRLIDFIFYPGKQLHIRK